MAQFEFDPSWVVIRLLLLLRLVQLGGDKSIKADGALFTR